MPHLPTCQARSRARAGFLLEPYQLLPYGMVGEHPGERQDRPECPGSPGGRKAPCPHSLHCGYASLTLPSARRGSSLLLKQRFWALLPKLMSQWRHRFCPSEALLSLEARGACGREPRAEVPSHPLPPGTFPSISHKHLLCHLTAFSFHSPAALFSAPPHP